MLYWTPPFASPDEPAHWDRAWAISEGQLVAAIESGKVGAELPRSLGRLVEAYDGGLAFQPGRRFAQGTFARAAGIQLEPTDRERVDFRNTAQSLFALYLPQAAACRLGRAVGARPLWIFHGARLANFVAATALLGWAISRSPRGRWFLAGLALSPMAAALRASLSADALAFAIAAAFLATVAALAETEGPLAGRLDLLPLLLTGVALGLSKPVYAPLLATLLLIPGDRLPGRRRSWLALPLGLALAGLAASLTIAVRIGGRMRFDVPVDSPAQLAFALHRPLATLGTLANDLLVHAPRYAAQALGHKLGWLDTPLPRVAVVTLGLGLALLAALEIGGRPREPGSRARLVVSLVAATGGALAIELAQWIETTPLAAPGVEGVQGRYFLPLLPLAILIARPEPNGGARRSQLRAAFVVGIALLSGVAAILALERRYYGGSVPVGASPSPGGHAALIRLSACTESVSSSSSSPASPAPRRASPWLPARARRRWCSSSATASASRT